VLTERITYQQVPSPKTGEYSTSVVEQDSTRLLHQLFIIPTHSRFEDHTVLQGQHNPQSSPAQSATSLRKRLTNIRLWYSSAYPSISKKKKKGKRKKKITG